MAQEGREMLGKFLIARLNTKRWLWRGGVKQLIRIKIELNHDEII